MDSWEALDVDDSDLPSLIRPTLLPCKRSLQQSQLSRPVLAPLSPCSHLSRPSQSQPKTQASQSEQGNEGSQSTSSDRLIPGPAGAVQAAMHRRALSKRNACDGEEEVSTQDYLRRAQEIEAEDEDFKLNPWLCAMELFCGNLVPGSPLSSIDSSLSTDRLPLVVAVVKSCTPNGFGDLIVTLKDPTGTIGASIHRNVLTESDFGRDISVGSVLILQKVVVFSPSRSARNLNITLRNVVKVIRKDSTPPTKTNLALTISGLHSGSELRETTPGMIEKATSMSRGAAEGIMNKVVRREMKEKELLVDRDQLLEQCRDGVESSYYSSSQCQLEPVDVEFQHMVEREGAATGARVGSVARDGKNEEVIVNYSEGQPKVGPLGHLNYSSSAYQNASAAAELHSSYCESGRMSAPMKQRQHLISKATLPEWTDEQLDELFADGFDNGNSLF